MVAVLIWSTTITPLQALGYGIALIGMAFYRSSWRDLRNCLASFIVSLRKLEKSQSHDSQISSTLLRRLALVVVVSIVGIALVYTYLSGQNTIWSMVVVRKDHIH